MQNLKSAEKIAACGNKTAKLQKETAEAIQSIYESAKNSRPEELKLLLPKIIFLITKAETLKEEADTIRKEAETDPLLQINADTVAAELHTILQQLHGLRETISASAQAAALSEKQKTLAEITGKCRRILQTGKEDSHDG